MEYMGKDFKTVNIPDYSNYMISKDGDIFSIERNRIIKHIVDEYGTHKIALQTDKHCEKHKFRVCDLLFKTWNIVVDRKNFPNLIEEDTEYLNRVNRTEMMYNGTLFKNINIPGYENYMVNSVGDIYTKRTGELMVPKYDKDGYLCIGLYSTITGKRINVRIHRAVMYTFGSPPPANDKDITVDHIDGNIINNDISNLRWLSRSENSLPIYKHTKQFKSEIKRNRISQERLREKCNVDGIVTDYIDNGFTKQQIREKYNVSEICFRDVVEPFINVLFTKNEELGLDDFDPDTEYDITDYTRFVEDIDE
jgi:hypothetical protein